MRPDRFFERVPMINAAARVRAAALAAAGLHSGLAIDRVAGRAAGLAVGVAIGLALALTAFADTPPRTVANLLDLPDARIEHTSDPGADATLLRALADGNRSRAVTVAAPDGSPVIVFGFGEQGIALEGVEISLGDPGGNGGGNPGAARPRAVDVLVSQVSPRAGFQSVRSEPLKETAGPQKLAFGAAGARWVMLKFRAGDDARAVALAELRLIGYQGSPQTRYKFNESPASTFEVLRQLEAGSGLDLSITADEQSLFADAADGRLDRWSFAEAALIASGVTRAADRKPYLQRIDRLEAEARKAVAKAATPFDQGAALLRYLHAGAFAKGYRSTQTRVSTLLDQRQFNCVSSAALYNILGRRLGLDLRAIEVPDHAFAILYHGTDHADVETTTAAGFNPARNREAQQAFSKLTGFNYIPDAHRDRRREVGETGLLALIVYNHGVELSREKRYPEALLAYFRAMSLDPEFGSAVQNALAVLANWSAELIRQRKFEDATRIAALGVRLAPNDAALVNNRKATWSQWADALARDGKTDDALTVLRRAEREVPDAGFGRMQAWVFIRDGETRIKAEDWAGARGVVAPGLAAGLAPAARTELLAWAADLPLRWSQSELRRGRFDGALDVLAARAAEGPPDPRIDNQIAYVVQERLRDTSRREGADAASALIPGLLERFAQNDGVRRVSVAQLQRNVVALADAGRHEEALAAAGRIATLAADAPEAAKVRAGIYDRWALGLAKERQWQQALDVYAKALPELGERGNAQNNIRYLLQEWLKEAGSTDPQRAVEILQRNLPRFPTVPGLDKVAATHVALRVQDLTKQAQYEPALAALDALAPLLPDRTDTARIAASVYDRWSQSLASKQQWQAAADVYQRGLQQFPDSGHLQNNAVVVWNQWAKTLIDRKDWAAAIGIFDQALSRFPGNSLLERNRRYCEEQRAKAG
ncbi:MAG: transglutaminase family protein [Lautropia sp.]